jgi:hypothetical protein
MRRDVKVDDSPGSEFNDEEEINLTKEQVDHWQEISSPDVLGVIVEKDSRGLTGRTKRSYLAHVYLNRGGGNLNIEFEEFATNALRTPKDIVFDHLVNQVDRFSGYLGATAMVAGFEFPEQAEAWTMPAEQGIGFEDQERLFPVLNTAGEQDEPEAIRLCEARFFDLSV